MTQGVPSTDSLPLDPDFPMDPSHLDPFDTSYLYPCLPDSVWDSSRAAGFYENHAQNFPFNPPTTLESTTTTFIPPSSMGMFNPHQARANITTATATARGLTSGLPSTSRKRGRSPEPVTVHGEGNKRRKFATHLVYQQVGARQDDHRSMAVTSMAAKVNGSNGGPLLGLPAANQALTNAITPPVATFDCPKGMSGEEYIAVLQAKIAMERSARLDYLA